MSGVDTRECRHGPVQWQAHDAEMPQVRRVIAGAGDSLSQLRGRAARSPRCPLRPRSTHLWNVRQTHGPDGREMPLMWRGGLSRYEATPGEEEPGSPARALILRCCPTSTMSCNTTSRASRVATEYPLVSLTSQRA